MAADKRDIKAVAARMLRLQTMRRGSRSSPGHDLNVLLDPESHGFTETPPCGVFVVWGRQRQAHPPETEMRLGSAAWRAADREHTVARLQPLNATGRPFAKSVPTEQGALSRNGYGAASNCSSRACCLLTVLGRCRSQHGITFCARIRRVPADPHPVDVAVVHPEQRVAACDSGIHGRIHVLVGNSKGMGSVTRLAAPTQRTRRGRARRSCSPMGMAFGSPDSLPVHSAQRTWATPTTPSYRAPSLPTR